MNSRRPINRVTSRRRPATSTAPAKKTTTRRVAGRPGPVDQRKSMPAPVGDRTDSGRRRLPRRADTARGGGPSRWRPAILCTVAALLLAAFAVTAAFRPGVDDSNRALVDNAETEQVKAAAAQVLSAVYAVDAKNLAGYKEAARKVLTGKALADSDKYLDGVAQAYQQTAAKSDVHTEPIGVTLLTSDRAEVLANTTVGITKDGAVQPSATGPILLRLEKVNGRWLASDLPNL
ncbi:hypothetical protein [Nocardia sp. NPDC051570]|uniref:hypothetical protein n=1 Tax=Nocardia sp. NPDC051570 TaxID=3364324 RepID=UPI0037B31251